MLTAQKSYLAFCQQSYVLNTIIQIKLKNIKDFPYRTRLEANEINVRGRKSVYRVPNSARTLFSHSFTVSANRMSCSICSACPALSSKTKEALGYISMICHKPR